MRQRRPPATTSSGPKKRGDGADHDAVSSRLVQTREEPLIMASERLIPWEQYARLLEQLGIPTNLVTATLTLVAGFLLAVLGRRLSRGLIRRGGHWLG